MYRFCYLLFAGLIATTLACFSGCEVNVDEPADTPEVEVDPPKDVDVDVDVQRKP